jgi:hypothetical protein
MQSHIDRPKKRVGFDLDGVLLVNPLGAVRPFLKYFRKNILKKKSTGSYTPKTNMELFINYFYIKLSYFKMRGYSEVIKLIRNNTIEAHIITSRHSAYKPEFEASVAMLNKYKDFTSATYNAKDLEPYVFKINCIEQLQLDYYIEDNFDVVKVLDAKFPGKILWLTNPIDQHLDFPLKFHNLHEVAAWLTKTPNN